MKKKLIAGLTSAAVIASLSAPAFAANFGDVKGATSEKAAGLLKALGVVNGDVNGNFNPNATITRAEFAKIAVLLAGYKNAADAYGTDVTPFNTDVKAGHWAAGYIQVAKDTGLVKGYDQWNFGPNDNVKYEEVLAVALRILGYNDNLPGAWPSDYVIKGTQLKLNDQTQFSIGKAATRGDVALIASAALNQSTVVYSKDTDSFEAGASLISSKFSNSVLKYQLKDSKTLTGTTLTQDGQIKYGVASSVYGGENFTATVNSDTIIAGGSLEVLVGKEVNLIKNSDNVVLYIADATKNTQVVTGALKGAVVNNTVTLSNDAAYTLAPNFVSLVNGELGASLGSAAKDDTVTLVLNASNQVEAISVKHFQAPAVVTSVATKTAVSAARVNGVPVADNAVVTLNGNAASVADLKEEDVVYYTLAAGKIAQLDAYRNVATGTLTAFTSADNSNLSTLTIGGTTYTVSSKFTLPNSDVNPSLLNKAVVALLDKDGKVAEVKAATATVNNQVIYVTDVTPSVYVIDPATGEATSYTKITYIAADNTEKTAFESTTSGYNFQDVTDENKTFKITFDTKGKVDSATPVTGTSTSIATDGVNATAKTVKMATGDTYYVTDKTVIFDVAAKKFVGFDALKQGQGVKFTADTTANNGANLSALLITSGGTSSALKNTAGVFVSSRSANVYDSATSTLTTKYYATLNIAGVNTEYQTESYDSAPVGDLVYLQDVDQDGTFNTVETSDVVVSNQVYKDTTVANGFDVDGQTGNYVFDANTKFYVVKFAGTGTNGAAQSGDWNTVAQRDAAVVGSSYDFTQLLDEAASNDYHVSIIPTTTTIAGYKLVDSVVVYLKK